MGNVSMEARDINYRGGETKMSVEEALKSTSGEAAAIEQLQTDVGNLQTETGNLQTTKANQITIAPFFSAETAYDPGDLVYYNGLTYRCVNAHEGEWDADDFAATTISGEIAELKSGLISVKTYTHTFTGGIPAGLSSVFILKSTGIPHGSKCVSVRAAYDIAGMLKVLYSVIESSSEYIIVVNNFGNAIETSVRIFIDYI